MLVNTKGSSSSLAEAEPGAPPLKWPLILKALGKVVAQKVPGLLDGKNRDQDCGRRRAAGRGLLGRDVSLEQAQRRADAGTRHRV